MIRVRMAPQFRCLLAGEPFLEYYMPMQILARYRSSLLERASRVTTRPAYWLELHRASAPWILPPVLGAAICLAFGLTGANTYYVTLPSGLLSVAGMSYVAAMFTVAWNRAAGRRFAAQRTEAEERSPDAR